MGILSSLRSMMSDEGFTPSASTFPEIDTNSIERSLKIRSKAKERGAENKPNAEQEASDAVELEIIDRMRFLRNQGTEFYENMLTAYQSRINRAESFSQEIETAALAARGNFLSSATNNRAEIAYSLTGVTEALKFLKDFRLEHKVNRPFFEETRSSIYVLIITIVLMLFFEVVINAGFFAASSPQGFAGGAFIAFAFALINVALGFLSGVFARYKNHINFLYKIFGISVIILFLAVSITLNVSIGVYRDALEAVGDPIDANLAWKLRIETRDFTLESIKSVILALLGFCISLVTIYKTYRSFDPYPGYARVARRVENAIAAYAANLHHTISDLEEQRDEFIEEFQNSSKALDAFLSEAADALAGTSALSNKLKAFYEDLEGKTLLLIQTYRDINVETRPDGKIPKSFFKKADFDLPTVEKFETKSLLEKADQRRSEISKSSEQAIRDITQIYEAYVSYFPSVEALREDWNEQRLPSWNTVINDLGGEELPVDFQKGDLKRKLPNHVENN